jgi:DNA-binding transcriptional ArsR family regulator
LSINNQVPDYDLDDLRIVSSDRELRAMAHRVRGTILELVNERAATVGELAEAIGRPKSTIAYHVDVLVESEMLKVVRTRKVRAIDERFYGRTARIFYVGVLQPEQVTQLANLLSVAASESQPAHEADDLRAILRHARIPRERAAEFWERVFTLTNEFTQLRRAGDTVHGFVVGLYPTKYPTLPPRDGEES